MEKFYIYQYFDPIRSEIIYIGKGTRRRLYTHLCESRLKKQHPLSQRIQWIKKQNNLPVITKLFENMNEPDALTAEAFLIELIGRKDLKMGSLLNLSNGGEGSSGSKRIFSEDHKQKIRTTLLGRKRSEESLKKASISLSGKIPWNKGLLYSHKKEEKCLQS